MSRTVIGHEQLPIDILITYLHLLFPPSPLSLSLSSPFSTLLFALEFSFWPHLRANAAPLAMLLQYRRKYDGN